MARRKKKFKISFLTILGFAIAFAATIGIWYSTGVLQPQPNLFTSK